MLVAISAALDRRSQQSVDPLGPRIPENPLYDDSIPAERRLALGLSFLEGHVQSLHADSQRERNLVLKESILRQMIPVLRLVQELKAIPADKVAVLDAVTSLCATEGSVLDSTFPLLPQLKGRDERFVADALYSIVADPKQTDVRRTLAAELMAPCPGHHKQALLDALFGDDEKMVALAAKAFTGSKDPIIQDALCREMIDNRFGETITTEIAYALQGFRNDAIRDQLINTGLDPELLGLDVSIFRPSCIALKGQTDPVIQHALIKELKWGLAPSDLELIRDALKGYVTDATVVTSLIDDCLALPNFNQVGTAMRILGATDSDRALAAIIKTFEELLPRQFDIRLLSHIGAAFKETQNSRYGAVLVDSLLGCSSDIAIHLALDQLKGTTNSGIIRSIEERFPSLENSYAEIAVGIVSPVYLRREILPEHKSPVVRKSAAALIGNETQDIKALGIAAIEDQDRSVREAAIQILRLKASHKGMGILDPLRRSGSRKLRLLRSRIARDADDAGSAITAI